REPKTPTPGRVWGFVCGLSPLHSDSSQLLLQGPVFGLARRVEPVGPFSQPLFPVVRKAVPLALVVKSEFKAATAADLMGWIAHRVVGRFLQSVKAAYGTEVSHGVASSLPAEIIDAIPRFEKGADDAVFGQHGELIGPLIVEEPVAVGTPFHQDVAPRFGGDQFLGPAQILFLGYISKFLLTDHVFDVMIVQMFFAGELGLLVDGRSGAGGKQQDQGEKGCKPPKVTDVHEPTLSPFMMMTCPGEKRRGAAERRIPPFPIRVQPKRTTREPTMKQ